MEAFIDAKIPTNKLYILNIIRMFLKAVTVSDIATSDGKSISYNAWNLIENNKLREDFDWPRQPPEFTQNQKNLWKASLRQALCDPSSLENDRKLLYRYQVGQWIDDTAISNWNLYYSSEESQVYMKDGNRWKSYCKVGATRRQQYAKKSRICSQ